jgi:hypothetical protein
MHDSINRDRLGALGTRAEEPFGRLLLVKGQTCGRRLIILKHVMTEHDPW